MKTELKQGLGPRQKEWVATLKGGKYKQGKGTLQYRDARCCLGIACIVSGLEKYDAYSDTEKLLGDTLSTQLQVKEYFKIKSEEGDFINENGNFTEIKFDGEKYRSLTELNDDGKSFEEIAKVIEEHAHLIFEAPV